MISRFRVSYCSLPFTHVRSEIDVRMYSFASFAVKLFGYTASFNFLQCNPT